MNARIGVSVQSDHVRAVVAQRGRAVWHDREAVDGSVGEALDRLLGRIPARAGRGSAIRVAVGPSRCQVARLSGLPARASAVAASQAVAAGPERFFLATDGPLATGPAELRGGTWWAAAFPRAVLDEIRAAVERRKLVVREFVPGLVMLPSVLEGETLSWPDGKYRGEVTVAGGTWTDARRLRNASGQASQPVRPRSNFEPLAREDVRYADAYAAAVTAKSPRIALRARSPHETAQRGRAIRGTLVAVAALSCLAAVAAPGVAAGYVNARMSRALDSLRGGGAAVARETYALQRATAVEDSIAHFASNRRSMLILLGALTVALPESTALVSFHVDSLGATAVVLSPGGAAVLAALDSIPLIRAPQIVGPISRETVGGADVERLAVRFAFPGAPAPVNHRRLPVSAVRGTP